MVEHTNCQTSERSYLTFRQLKRRLVENTVLHILQYFVEKTSTVSSTVGWSVEIFFIGQNRSSNQRSGMIFEVQIQNCPIFPNPIFTKILIFRPPGIFLK